MSLRRWTFAVAVGCLFSCNASAPPEPELTRQESLLVDLYVRIRLLEDSRRVEPDSVEVRFQELARTRDSTAVHQALRGLETDPRRWEIVFGAIANRLQELEDAPSVGTPAPDSSR